jgi:hypothetical protein
VELTGESRRAWSKTSPSGRIVHHKSTRMDLIANPGLGGERPATNRLSHGTASNIQKLRSLFHIQCVSSLYNEIRDTRVWVRRLVSRR